MLGNFSCFCCRLQTFFKINFFKKSFRNTIRLSNGLDPDQDCHVISPDLGPNCLQRLSADDLWLLARKESLEVVRKSEHEFWLPDAILCT